ncbi:MAG TPA: MFS transporter [Burkholderiales bacterium]|nr:MFS transporter [Burkholderiales bacterium]
MNTLFAPFAVRSYRFQWPSDLATSIGFEMEALILGWYVLNATGSVEWLVAFGALPWLGAIFAPFLGIAGDRLGLRTMLCTSRAGYALLAGTLTTLTLIGALTPVQVFVLYGLTGLMRPSDQAMRNVLIAQTAAPATLMGALGLSRTTGDMAKVLGSLAGAGGVALIGMGPAYVVVTLLYVSAFLLALGLARPPLHAAHASAHDVLAGLKDATRYVWKKPDLFGAFFIAFIGNLLAFPFVLGLLPYAAKEIYRVGQSGLGYLAAAFALGALAGSLMVGASMMRVAAGRMMLWSCGVWFIAVILFGQTRSFAFGLALLFLSGFMQSLCLTPLAAVMLRGSSLEMRGRVMGMRVLAVWGLPLGLLATGPLIAHFGYVACTALYGTLGLAATLAVGYRCRDDLWRRAAPANSPV